MKVISVKMKKKKKKVCRKYSGGKKITIRYYQITLSNFSRTSLLETSRFQNEQLRHCYANGRRSIKFKVRLNLYCYICQAFRFVIIRFSNIILLTPMYFKIPKEIK